MKPGLLQSFKTQWAERKAACLMGAGLAVFLGVLLLWIPVAHPLVTWSYDLPFNLPHRPAVPEEVVIVYMDEVSHQELGQPYDAPWDRALHARLLEQLTAAGARMVVFDIIFAGPGPDPVADEALAAAIGRHGNVILSGDLIYFEQDFAALEQLLPPHEPFRDAAAEWGLVGLAIPGGARAPRQHLHDLSDQFPSLSWAAAAQVGARSTRPAESRSEPRWIRYYGPPGALPNVSFHHALSLEDLAPGFFRGKVVFVGAKPPAAGFSGAHRDELATPYSPWIRNTHWNMKYSPGVEIHATCFLNLLQGDWLDRLSPWAELPLVVVWGMFLGLVLVPSRPLHAAGVAAITIFVLSAAVWLLFWKGHAWFAWIVLFIQVGAGLGWAVLYNSMRGYVERKLMMQTLSLHLSPARAKVVMSQPELLRPGAELQGISILFSDIADFSATAEKMPPNALAELLNKYFDASISSIHRTDGTVVKLIGDAIFAIWNAPVPQPDHQKRACRAALDLTSQEVELSTPAASVPVLRTRVGLHSGAACVGNFGSSTRFDYTAIGDSVNLASRLEGLNRFLGTSVLMSEEMRAAVWDAFVTRHVGRFVFKGFERVVEVHEIVGLIEQEAPTCRWRESFATALHAFQQRDFETAARLFRQVMEEHPEDGPSRFYLARIEKLEMEPPTPGWNGEIVLTEK